MTSIETQNNEIQIEPKNCQNINEDIQPAPIITLVEGLSGTLYRNESCGNGIPDKLLCD